VYSNYLAIYLFYYDLRLVCEDREGVNMPGAPVSNILRITTTTNDHSDEVINCSFDVIHYVQNVHVYLTIVQI
jgi:hypothetical protein